jgi:uncharacterized protein YukE
MADIHMDYGMVQNVADVCNTAAETLNKVNQVLTRVADVVAASAFTGFVGTAAAEEIESIRQAVSKLAGSATTINGDLNGAIKAIRDGDLSGSQRFA